MEIKPENDPTAEATKHLVLALIMALGKSRTLTDDARDDLVFAMKSLRSRTAGDPRTEDLAKIASELHDEIIRYV